MLKSYFHATPFENLGSIFKEGIHTGYDGVVYLTEKPQEAARFVAIRGCKKILVIEVEIEKDMVEETFDHSEAFFKCKAYAYPKDISINEFGNNIQTYEV
jgi:RNA:NAD 2'-phosphotransferase (TPT1/KptA family)